MLPGLLPYITENAEVLKIKESAPQVCSAPSSSHFYLLYQYA